MNGLTRTEVAAKAVDEGNEVIQQIIKQQINETILKFIKYNLDSITEKYKIKYGIDPNLKLIIEDDIKPFLRAEVGEGVSWKKNG